MAFLDSVFDVFSIGADTAGSFFGDIGTGIGEFAGDVFEVGGDLLSVGSGIVDLAGPLLLNGAQAWSTMEAVEAAEAAGIARADTYFKNADLLRGQIPEIERQTAEQITRVRFEGLRALSRQRAQYAVSGVTLDGSPLLVLEETRDLIESDVDSLIKRNKALTSSVEEQAQLQEQKAGAALDEASFQAQQVAVGGAIDVAESFF